MRTLGLWEHVLIRRVQGGPWKCFEAKLDTGATWSRIGKKKAAMLGLGPVIHTPKIKTGSGREVRDLVVAKVWIGGHLVSTEFTVSKMRAGINIGRNTMGTLFKVNPSQEYLIKPRPAG
jgi:hypothetical protein